MPGLACCADAGGASAMSADAMAVQAAVQIAAAEILDRLFMRVSSVLLLLLERYCEIAFAPMWAAT